MSMNKDVREGHSRMDTLEDLEVTYQVKEIPSARRFDVTILVNGDCIVATSTMTKQGSRALGRAIVAEIKAGEHGFTLAEIKLAF